MIASDFSPRSVSGLATLKVAERRQVYGVCTCRRSAACACSLHKLLGLKSEAIA